MPWHKITITELVFDRGFAGSCRGRTRTHPQMGPALLRLLQCGELPQASALDVTPILRERASIHTRPGNRFIPFKGKISGERVIVD